MHVSAQLCLLSTGIVVDFHMIWPGLDGQGLTYSCTTKNSGVAAEAAENACAQVLAKRIRGDKVLSQDLDRCIRAF